MKWNHQSETWEKACIQNIEQHHPFVILCEQSGNSPLVSQPMMAEDENGNQLCIAGTKQFDCKECQEILSSLYHSWGMVYSPQDNVLDSF
jgi:hypothetical protein